jgi:hypothetical protein
MVYLLPFGFEKLKIVLHEYKKRRPAENLTAVGRETEKNLRIVRPEDAKMGP